MVGRAKRDSKHDSFYYSCGVDGFEFCEIIAPVGLHEINEHLHRRGTLRDLAALHGSLVQLVTCDEDFGELNWSDAPSLGLATPVFRTECVERVAAVLGDQALFADMPCVGASLVAMWAKPIKGAVDWASSHAVVDASKRVVAVTQLCINASAVQGVSCFTDAELPGLPVTFSESAVRQLRVLRLKGSDFLSVDPKF